MILFKEAKNKEKLKQIRENPYYADELHKVHEIYEDIKDRSIEVLTKSEYFIYNETGNRLEFERKYFERRTRLDVYFIEYLLYERSEDLKHLEDIIWAICGEFSWSLPAHIGWNNAMEDMVHIDLFAAETGQTLGEILYILNDKLSGYIKSIMQYEINRRIIASFENKVYHWEKVTNNWSAVCAGCVGMTFIYCAPDRYEKVEKRIMRALECFLSGYGDDGICTEGLGYWKYGFGYYTYFAQLLYEFSNAEKDIMNSDKVREIAQFQQRIYLNGNAVVSFSDGNRHGSFSSGLTHRLKGLFPDCVTVPDNCYANKNFAAMENRFAIFVRNFLWTNPEYAASEDRYIGTQYYPSAQWYISIKDKFGFAAKCGHNGEPHNHNDIGGFIIAAQVNQLISDIGWGEYTKDYFNNAKRYQNLCCSSEGHSVPVIDGQLQSAGEEYAGNILKCSDNQFIIDISGAYAVQELNSAVRSFNIYDDHITLNDRFEFADNKTHKITERFISIIEPKTENDCIVIGNLKLSGADNFTIVCDMAKDHSGKDFSVWKIEYDVSGNEFTIDFNIIC